MKTAEELNTIKEEVEVLNKKLSELTEEDLAQVSGGRHNIRTPLTSVDNNRGSENISWEQLIEG